MNRIPERQNAPQFLRLLRARAYTYLVARKYQAAQLLLTVAVPFAFGLVGIFAAELRPFAGAYAVLITIADIAWIDRSQRQQLKKAARISEQFDCDLFDLPENKFVSDGRLDPELMERAARSWTKGDDKLRDWYPKNIGNAPMRFARIICQRAALRYDGELRKSYGRLLVILAAIIIGVLAIIGLSQNLPMLDFVTTSVTPAGPILVWTIRERFRQRDTAALVDRLRREAEAFWDAATACDYGEEYCLAKSRSYQDAIFNHRSNSPMIFPFLYGQRRQQLEREMLAGAEQMLQHIGVRQS